MINQYIVALVFLLLQWCTVGNLVQAQNSASSVSLTEGKVTFKLEYLEYAEELQDNEELVGLLPKEFVLYFKGRQNRTEISGMEMGGMVILTNAETGDVTTLLELPGEKVALEQKGKDNQAKNETLLQNMTVQETSETKKIAGYDCKKVIITYRFGEETKTTSVYYAPELPACNNQDFPMVKGFLMEYEEEDDDGTRVKVSVTEVHPQTVTDDLFKIPEGYRNITEDEFIESIGK